MLQAEPAQCGWVLAASVQDKGTQHRERMRCAAERQRRIRSRVLCTIFLISYFLFLILIDFPLDKSEKLCYYLYN